MKTSRVVTRGIRRMMCVSFIVFLYIYGNRDGSFFSSCEYSTRASARDGAPNKDSLASGWAFATARAFFTLLITTHSWTITAKIF